MTSTCIDRITLSRREVATATGLSLSIVQREILAGRLRSVRVGGRVLVPRGAVNEWLGLLPEEETLPLAS